jgi:osmotically-inducible protein OsmY
MFAVDRVPESADRALDAYSTADGDLQNAVLYLLYASGYPSLRTLRCEVAEADVVLRGTLTSYYLKEMAQSIVRRIAGVRGVKNLVEVRTSEHD